MPALEYYVLGRKKNMIYLVYHVIDQEKPVEHLQWFPVGLTLRQYLDLGGEREDVGSLQFFPEAENIFRSRIKEMSLTLAKNVPDFSEELPMPDPRTGKRNDFLWKFGKWVPKEHSV